MTLPLYRSVFVILGVICAIAPVLPAPALICYLGDLTPASPQIREYHQETLGVILKIPSNYRAVLRNTGHIAFLDPTSFEYLQCLARTGEYGVLPPHAVLEIYSGLGSSTDLIQILRHKRPWLDFYTPTYYPITFDNLPGLQYEYLNAFDSITYFNLSYLTPDGQTLLTISGPKNHPILQDLISRVHPLSLDPEFQGRIARRKTAIPKSSQYPSPDKVNLPANHRDASHK